jgi:hypothetical protein
MLNAVAVASSPRSRENPLAIGVFLLRNKTGQAMNDQVSHPLAKEFHRARLGAMRAAIDDLILHRPPSLLINSAAQLTIRARLDRGLKSAPIYQIIGRPARYDDLDRWLAPAHVSAAGGRAGPGQALIELYQVAETYVVKDGNRRVAEARARGQLFLLARVTECVIDGALDDPADMHAQLLREEYRDFQAATDLAQLRPAQQIACTALGGYAELIRQIEAYRAELAAWLGHPIERHVAVASWCDSLYLPVIAALRRQHVLEELPGRGETDLYIWVTNRTTRPLAQAIPVESPPIAPPDSIMRFVADLRCA